MGVFQFAEPVEGELMLSGKPVLVLGAFDNGKFIMIRASGEIQIMDEPVRVFMRGWPVESENSLDTPPQDAP